MTLNKIKLGTKEIARLGLGAMPLSIEGRPSKDIAIEVIHSAIDNSINHIDTAFAYYLAGGTQENEEVQHNEKLIKSAFESYKGNVDLQNVVVGSKVGHERYLSWDNKPLWNQRGDSRYIIETGKKSREALGVDSIYLYYYHRPDKNVEYSDSLNGLKVLIQEGVIQFAGISNASIDQIKMAQDILQDKFIAVQNQFSPAVTHTIDTLKYCEENGLVFIPWSPLGGFRSPHLLEKDTPFEKVAKELGISKQRVILAWELSLGKNIVPIPGFRRLETLLDSLKALDDNIPQDKLEFLTSQAIG